MYGAVYEPVAELSEWVDWSGRTDDFCTNE